VIFSKKLVLSIVIIAAVSMMMSTVIIQEANANPKGQKTTVHCKNDADGDAHCGFNSNGPDGHQNVQTTIDGETGEVEQRCKGQGC
jgi:hypothetical protein